MSREFRTGNVYYPKAFREHLLREEMRAHWPPDNGPGWLVSVARWVLDHLTRRRNLTQLGVLWLALLTLAAMASMELSAPTGSLLWFCITIGKRYCWWL